MPSKRSPGSIGILTGGGDCPGLNAVIRAVVRSALPLGYKVAGLRNGWLGLLQSKTMDLSMNSVSGILPRGGTILGTSRTNPLRKPEDKAKLLKNFKKMKLKALIAVGGEDTLSVARYLAGQGAQVVGIPKTIDNDVEATDQTFGFDTAVSIVTESHRPPPYHGRIARTRHGGRGHGAAYGLDLHGRRPRRRRRPDSESRASRHHSGNL